MVVLIFNNPLNRTLWGAMVLAVPSSALLASRFWFLWKLCSMPHCNYPNNIPLCFIEKSVGWYYNFTVWEFRKFRYNSSRLRQIFKPSQNCFSFIPKVYCCWWFIPSD